MRLDDGYVDEVSKTFSKSVSDLRPGMDLPDKPQEVKDAEEKKAKVKLTELLDEDFEQEKVAVYLKSYSSLQHGYISTIDKLRPQAKPFLVQTKDDRKKEAQKVKKYDYLQNAWDQYVVVAQDKPDAEDLTPEEEAAEEKVIEVESAVNNDWQEYAEEVVKAVQDNDGSDDDSEDDDDWDFWILEAKKLKAKAERKKAKAERKKAKEEKKRLKKEKKKRRKEEEEKRLEAEEENIARLKEKTRKKKEEEEKAKPSMYKEGNVDSNDTENFDKTKSRIEEERKRMKEERRQERKAAETKKKMAEEDVKEIVFGCREEARRRHLAFGWYSHLSAPNRSEFKKKVASITGMNITPDDVDLLPWNATASVVNIAKMNALTRASLKK
jgi:hypothetical protein